MLTNRRNFLKSAAAAVAATSLPQWYVNELSEPIVRAADDLPAIALIGCGGMGRGDAKNASRFGRIVALCDVDDKQIAEAKKQWPDAESYKDFRRVMDRQDIQVVVCGTVDHWHTLVSLAALRSKKDVYCEKPLTLTIEGSDGWIWVTRGKIEASDPEFLTTPLPPSAVRLAESNDHMGNFFDSLRSRKPPICEAEIGHRSATVCHLGVISLRLGRKLQWDPQAEQFVNDPDANRWIKRKLRKPWSYDMG